MAGSTQQQMPGAKMARIESCHADFEVTSPDGPLSSPERLLAAVRQELLPALSEVLEAPEWRDIDLATEYLEIDIGDWPDDPLWSQVRHVVATKLRLALLALLPDAATSMETRSQRKIAGQTAPLTGAGPDMPRPTRQQTSRGTNSELTELGDRDDTSASASNPSNLPKRPEQNRAHHDITMQMSPANGPMASAAVAALLADQPPDVDMRLISTYLADHPSALATVRAWLTRRVSGTDSPLPVDTAKVHAVAAAMAALAQDNETSRSDVSGTSRLAQAGGTVRTDPDTTWGAPASGAGRLGIAGRSRGDTSNITAPGSDTSQADLSIPSDPPVSNETIRQKVTYPKRDLIVQPATSDPDGAARRNALDRLISSLSHADAEKDLAEEICLYLLARLRNLRGPPEHRATAGPAVLTHPDSKIRPDSATAAQGPREGDVATGKQAHHGAGTAQSKNARARLLSNAPRPDLGGNADRREPVPKQPFPKQTAQVSLSDAAAGTTSAPPQTQIIGHETERFDALIASLATRIGLGSQSRTAALLANAFRKAPATLFTIATVSEYAVLVQLMGDTTVSLAVLTGPDRLQPEHIRRLAGSAPIRFAQALRHLSAPDALSLAVAQLPAEAELLASELARLQSDAISPAHALRAALLDLVLGRPLDVEALRKRTEHLPAQNPESPGVLNDPGVDAFEHKRSDGDDAVPAAYRALALQRQLHVETPLEVLLSLAGFSRTEIAHIYQPPSPDHNMGQVTHRDERGAQSDRHDRDPTTGETMPPHADAPGPPPDAMMSPPSAQHDPAQSSWPRSDAALAVMLEGLIGPNHDDTSDHSLMLELIWRLWPSGGSVGDANGKATGIRSLLARLVAAVAAQTSATLPDRIRDALTLLEPDASRRHLGLRIVAARLKTITQTDPSGLRARTAATLDEMSMSAPVQRPVSPEPFAGRPADPWPDETVLPVSAHAGLVLLHPFYPLLFERIGLRLENRVLAERDLPAALGALRFLAGGARNETDPLHRILLGVDATRRLPQAEDPDVQAAELMDGLLRSVIARWGRLGATSPDGLRETFLRRTGTLRAATEAVRLTVLPGPFDMLLDSLPWSVGPVALPWMRRPCLITWRGDNDA